MSKPTLSPDQFAKLSAATDRATPGVPELPAAAAAAPIDSAWPSHAHASPATSPAAAPPAPAPRLSADEHMAPELPRVAAAARVHPLTGEALPARRMQLNTAGVAVVAAIGLAGGLAAGIYLARRGVTLPAGTAPAAAA